jgi:hypothetical protein
MNTTKPKPKEVSPAQWFSAREKLTRLIAGYAMVSATMPGVPAVKFADLNQMAKRYQKGERTRQLYNQIMRAKL